MSYVVSITRLRVRAPHFLPGFSLRTFRALNPVRRADGFQGGSLLADRRWTFWTMTVLTDQASMRASMTAGDHRAAMPLLLDWCAIPAPTTPP